MGFTVLSQTNHSKTVVANVLGFRRQMFYYQYKMDGKDKELVNSIEKIYAEDDDTLGPRPLGKLLQADPKRVARVMKKFGIEPRRNRPSYKYGGKSNDIFGNLANSEEFEHYEIVFSDILEFKLSDGTVVRGCFAIRKVTRQILSMVFDYGMDSRLVAETLDRIDLYDFTDTEVIWHSDQGKQYGSGMTVDRLVEKGFLASMSRAGTPTDNPFAERFVQTFKLSVVQRYSYDSLGKFLYVAEKWLNFYNQRRPHSSLGMKSPNKFAADSGLGKVPKIIVGTV